MNATRKMWATRLLNLFVPMVVIKRWVGRQKMVIGLSMLLTLFVCGVIGAFTWAIMFTQEEREIATPAYVAGVLKTSDNPQCFKRKLREENANEHVIRIRDVRMISGACSREHKWGDPLEAKAEQKVELEQILK